MFKDLIMKTREIAAMRFNLGSCPVCGKNTVFIEKGKWLRDNYICASCGSIPRQRELISILKELVPEYRDKTIHESSPSGATFRTFTNECKGYSYSYFYKRVKPGAYENGIRCENLEAMTFEGESFDIFITQDVLEHVLDPDKAFSEICRVLKPGGLHIFTVPYYGARKTYTRAKMIAEKIEYLDKRLFHGNPIDSGRSLVVTEWGNDICERIYSACGMSTTIFRIKDRKQGLDGEFLEVFVSRKQGE